MEYQFDWKGDETDLSPWGSGTQTKIWAVGGVYTVRARARSVTHTGTVSAWTSGLTVTIELVTAPTAPVGPSAGSRGVEYSFSTGGAVSNLNHPLEYQFDWGDGTVSDWGPPTRTHTWDNFTDFQVRARARCAIDPTVVSDWSDETPFSIELVTAPSQPNGNLNGMRGAPYTYTSSGAISTNGHTLEYQFDWGDGTTSPWTVASADPSGTTSASALKVWTSSGTYLVRARARCQQHPDIMSDWSSGLPVAIEFTSAPSVPSGPTNGTVGEGYFYSTGGSSVDSGHAVQYQFDWGDGTASEWLPVGVTGVGKAWKNPGTYAVRAHARCAIHIDVISDWSPALSVTMVPGPPPPTETISTPFIETVGGRGSIYTVTSNLITGVKNIPYTFTNSAAVSNLGDVVEYEYDWGDGTFSPWGGPYVKAWPVSRGFPGYIVKVRARCVKHPTVLSDWSNGLEVRIDYITPPVMPVWVNVPADGLGDVGIPYTFSSGNSISEIGQDIQYRFNWGDGTNSGWLPLNAGVPSGTGTVSADHTYALQGTYIIKVDARGWDFQGAGADGDHFSYYSPELSVKIIGGPPPTTCTSADPLDCWSLREDSVDLGSVVYGNGLFVGVGFAGVIGGEIWTSPDGATWTQRSSGNIVYQVAYGNSKFVAVGSSGTIITSLDGKTWSHQASRTTNHLRGVAFGNGFFMAVGDSGTVVTSPDGITWTLKSSNTTRNLTKLRYLNNLFVTIGASSSIVLSSADGITWTEHNTQAGYVPNDVAYGNNTYVVVGGNGKIFTSPNLVTWTERTSTIVTTNSLNAVIYSNGFFVAVGVSGTIITSTDGINWIVRPYPTSSLNSLYDVTFGGGTFVAVGVDAIQSGTVP